MSRLFAPADPSRRPDGDRAFLADLAEFVEDAMRVTGTPGLNLAVARGGRVVYEAGFGYADLASGRRMEAESVSRAGSIAKICTATAFLQLVELGVLDLYDEVREHLPGVRVVNPLGEREITIHDLLTFHSGLVRDTLEANVAPVDAEAYVEAELHRDVRREYRGRSSRWSARVGERYQYSSFGYAILARLFREANPEGFTLGEWARRHVFEPLGMSSTVLPAVDDDAHVPAHIRGRRTTGYARFGPVYVPCPTMYTGSYAGSGLQTTPGDLARLLLALLGDGVWEGRRVLAPSSVRRMLTPQRSASEGERAFGNLTQAGLGIELANVGRRDFHFGRIGSYPWGWWHHARAYPTLDLTVVVLTNKWDMQGWMNPDGRSAGALVADWLATRVRAPHAPRERRPWAWRLSYAAGLLMAERIAGLLGLPERLDAATVEAMAADARALLPTVGEEPWDEAGFRAGVADVVAIDAHPSRLRGLLDSAQLRVGPEELPLLWLRLGSQGRSPIPMSFYASALDEAERAGR